MSTRVVTGGLAAFLGVASVILVVASGGSLVAGLAPGLALCVCCAVGALPLRYALWPLGFLALTLENPADAPAAGAWKSGLYPLGAALLTHLNLTFPAQRWMAFSGLDLAIVALFVLGAVRALRGSRLDRPSVDRATPMRASALTCLVAVAVLWLWGVARGDADVASSLWQIQRIATLPVVYLLFELAYRGPEDRADLAKLLLVAAVAKAGLAIYLRAILPPPAGAETIDYATTHADSMLFAAAACMILAILAARPSAGRVVLGLLALGLIVGGMVANHRRVVWVELGAGALVVLLLSSRRARRAVARVALCAAPFALVYLAIGWGAQGGVFAPVQTIRSVVDSNADPSTAWRDWENYDLFFTLRQGPLFGSGLGHGYIETVQLPPISQMYALYRFAPHNSILGLWAYGGLFGFAAIWWMWIVGMFLAARAARFAKTPADRTAATTAGAVLVVYLVHCYGDMGLGTWTSVFTVAPALAVLSRLAVATGAWPARRPAAVSTEPAAVEWRAWQATPRPGGI